MVGQCDMAFAGMSDTSLVQLALPNIPGVLPRVRRGKPKRRIITHAGDADPLLNSYLRRLAARGVAPKGYAAYRYQLRTLLGIAARHAGFPVSLVALFHDPALLGHVLVHDRGTVDERQLSRWTLAQRRSAIRSFASLMCPELAALGVDAHAVLDRALRAVAERVGTGYRLTGGRSRHRGGYAPTIGEVAAVMARMGEGRDFATVRDVAFFGILAESGARVNALRELDGADCVTLPSGRIRLFLHAKGGEEAREVEVSRDRADELRRYTEAFNRHATTRGWRTRVCLGKPGPVWRNSPRGHWPYQAVVAALHDACIAAGISSFGPHGLRRAFASNAASVLPRHVVARAGGWRGLERLDDHYVQARDAPIASKLRHAGATVSDYEHCEVTDAPIAPVPGEVSGTAGIRASR